MSLVRVRVLLLASLLTLLPVSSAAGKMASPAYLRPAEFEGEVFPLARSNWYSVINFENDWHEPRMRLIAGQWQLVGIHEGTDVFAEPGTPILTVHPGIVERVGWTFYSGWRVGVRGDDGRYWFYAHLSSFSDAAVVGRRVEAGDPLGRVGNTGYGVTPGHFDEFTHHLHFGIQEASGIWVNPYPLLKRLYQASVKA